MLAKGVVYCALLGFLTGCGGGKDGSDSGATASGSPSGAAGGTNNGTTSGTPGSSVTTPSFVTVGVFIKEANGSYSALGQEITFEVGVPCFTWDRTSGPHDGYDKQHQHYNASDDNIYEDGTFYWTEFGPAHDQASVDDACASGLGGADKWANWTEYYEEQHGKADPYYLQIIDAY